MTPQPISQTPAAPKSTGTGESRVARKRQQARSRIVSAARELLRENTADQITIADITAAADVGHGSFYLHFKSKYDVLLPVLVEEAAAQDVQLRAALRDEPDPAVIMGISARFMGYHIVRDDLWRWFLKNSGVPTDTMRHALGTFSNRDFLAGVRSGRFRARHRDLSAVFAFGGFVSAILEAMESETPDDAIDAATELLLLSFGVPADEAMHIAAMSLPTLPPDYSDSI